ncbi:MAG: type II secretion system GspH family protein [Planctomycetales bacterium]|nr:type II secretion system GspH family protein [Planctomycetales bacterium]
MKRNTNIGQAGFTLVELLTTLAVIAVLLALMIPALSQVQKTAANVKQKCQFSAIGIALEAFRSDTGDYPLSVWDEAVYGKYSASQRLAEAVIGQDGFGFHPSSRFRADGTDGTNFLYAPDVDLSVDSDNLAARKGPYLELESANAVKLTKLYGTGFTALADTFILADMYKTAKNLATGKMTGMPILYYKANRLKMRHAYTLGTDNAGTVALYNTYNVYDSINAISLLPDAGTHGLLGDPGWFYINTHNPNFDSPNRPYRAESFLLHSAGPDGLYGTADDVFNFDREK